MSAENPAPRPRDADGCEACGTLLVVGQRFCLSCGANYWEREAGPLVPPHLEAVVQKYWRAIYYAPAMGEGVPAWLRAFARDIIEADTMFEALHNQDTRNYESL